MDFKAGCYYRTKSGGKVVLYKCGVEGIYPLHGAYLTLSGWLVAQWSHDGVHPNSASLNLVDVWQDLRYMPGVRYKTRSGLKVRIYANDGETDGDFQQPIHGAYLLGGSWFSAVWRDDGLTPCRENNELDLVAVWNELLDK